ncbi:helix-turn-helix domain-containing protein [Arthrobacter sp. PsM3]|uniref:helix-turn-helix domain-containing protein n=1 Tax=Arthrobacter sp. PsM3 TaxID=3030531 RepID=UPI00263B9C62|nr:helix-turn-helix transcriptional regulator [Arthrobacter sp. PsM3]MDN4644978.1 helix-turn-helix transcriptional regulator [Arthrobacter sp. PsM3]
MQSKNTRWYEYVLNVTDGMSAKEVADRAHFDQSAMTRWKKGLNVDPKFAVQFARAFNQNVLHALAEAELITEDEADLHEVKVGLDEISTQRLLEELARRIDNPSQIRGRRLPGPRIGSEADDPDYSKLSDQDAYDLASHKGEPNIGHDEVPHEP